MSIDDIVADIKPIDDSSMEAARQRQQRLTKPPGSLGRLEELSVQAAGALGSGRPAIRRQALIVVAADHGVVAEGSQRISAGSDCSDGDELLRRWCGDQCDGAHGKRRSDDR